MHKPTFEFLRRWDKDYWQMREALGYSMPYWVQKRWPRQFQDGGSNPYVCGICESRRRYPDLHNGTTEHASDCAMHNAPALPVGECDCK